MPKFDYITIKEGRWEIVSGDRVVESGDDTAFDPNVSLDEHLAALLETSSFYALPGGVVAEDGTVTAMVQHLPAD